MVKRSIIVIHLCLLYYNIIPNVGDVVRILLPYGASNDEYKKDYGLGHW